MGNGRWDSNAWDAYASANTRGKTQSQIFTATGLREEFDPARIAFRESRDGPLNPAATPVILASDVTGSMGMIAHALMQDGINTLATEIYDRGPVSNAHVMVLAVGDAKCDRAPLQATQFEADIRLADQVRQLYVEGNGGGNGGESYSGAHLFAALKTSHDAFERRGRKGYLFTVGDEPVHDGMTREEISRVLGLDVERDVTAAEAVAMAARTYEVFHVVLANEGYAASNHGGGGLGRVLETWKPILPERVMLLDDVSKLAEVVVSAIQVTEGAHKDAVAASWKATGTAMTVANAIGGLPSRGQGRGVRRLGA